MPTKFETLSPAEKRVAIAKDVIAQLKAEKVRARTGVFIRPNPQLGLFVGKELQTALKKLEVPCEGCALGSMFISAVRKTDNYVITSEFACNGIGGAYNMVFPSFFRKLREFFSLNQLQMIEIAFEAGPSSCSEAPISAEKRAKATEFGFAYLSSASMRLIAICENIIANKGEFIP